MFNVAFKAKIEVENMLETVSNNYLKVRIVPGEETLEIDVGSLIQEQQENKVEESKEEVIIEVQD